MQALGMPAAYHSYHSDAQTGEAMPDGESNDDGMAGPALAIGFILLLVAVFGAYFLFVMK